MKKFSVSIIGATGYTGQELVKLLLSHPQVEIFALTSRQDEGVLYSDLFPQFKGRTELKLSHLDIDHISANSDTVFLCLPHHQAMETAAKFLAKNIRVIDLSADFRLKNSATYELWYGPHTQSNLINEAVYGLPEIYRDQIKKAQLVASPGCYPTSAILGLYPLCKEKLIEPNSIIIDAKSGVTGAGRSAKLDLIYSEVNENFKAYKIGQHRHTPEINQELSLYSETEIQVTFTPHLVPMNRGILSTIYVKLSKSFSQNELNDLYQTMYGPETFVQVLNQGEFPQTFSVAHTNFCQIGLYYNQQSGQAIIVSAIDNLIKGASGQALQAFNIMNQINETVGLL